MFFNIRYVKWFDAAANVRLNDGSNQVCRLKQTCTSVGVGRKYLTTVMLTDVMLLKYVVDLEVARGSMEPKPIPKACGLVNYLFTPSVYTIWPCCLSSCQT